MEGLKAWIQRPRYGPVKVKTLAKTLTGLPKHPTTMKGMVQHIVYVRILQQSYHSPTGVNRGHKIALKSPPGKTSMLVLSKMMWRKVIACCKSVKKDKMK